MIMMIIMVTLMMTMRMTTMMMIVSFPSFPVVWLVCHIPLGTRAAYASHTRAQRRYIAYIPASLSSHCTSELLLLLVLLVLLLSPLLMGLLLLLSLLLLDEEGDCGFS